MAKVFEIRSGGNAHRHVYCILRPVCSVFVKSDCTMLEVNPLAETDEHLLVAADAKLNFDGEALQLGSLTHPY
jgi:succinyl-CoA synthetase beta subunit